MTKVNIEGFIEVECPILNKSKMKELELTASPRLKVQVFLGEFNNKYGEEEYNTLQYTRVVCREKEEVHCMKNKNHICLYVPLTISKKKDK